MCARLLLKTPHRSLSYMLRMNSCADASTHTVHPNARSAGPAAAERAAPPRPSTRLRSGQTPYRKMLRGLCVYLPNAVSDRAFRTHTRYLGSISKRVRKPVGMQKPPFLM